MRQAPAELAPAFFTAYPDPAKGCIGKRLVLAAAARRLVRLSRIYALVHIFLTWSLGSGGMLEALARLALEIVLATVLVGFWRAWRPLRTAQQSLYGLHGRLGDLEVALEVGTSLLKDGAVPSLCLEVRDCLAQ